jgi:hypothetical protein
MNIDELLDKITRNIEKLHREHLRRSPTYRRQYYQEKLAMTRKLLDATDATINEVDTGRDAGEERNACDFQAPPCPLRQQTSECLRTLLAREERRRLG